MKTDAPTDAKKGWSTNCRAGNHSTCQTIGAACTCSCHGENGQAPKRGPGRPPKLVEAPTRREAKRTVALVWEEPPAVFQGKKTLHALLRDELAELKENPATWARLVEYPSKSAASAAAKTLKKHLPEDAWEFRGVVDGGGSRLYGRYIGGDSA